MRLRCALLLSRRARRRSPPLNKLTSSMKAFKTRWFVLRKDSPLLR